MRRAPLRSRSLLSALPDRFAAFLVAFVVLALAASPSVFAGPFLSEFMAANASGLTDADREFNDWIEIHNPDPAPVSLDGWFLTDDPTELQKWRVPAVTLPGYGFVVVFASGKDRTDPARELHTNFKLSRDGEYLALVHPDGMSVADAYAPEFPRQVADLSYGRAMTRLVTPLVSDQASARFFVPPDNSLGLSWIDPAFSDSAWTAVAMPVGYDRPQAGSPEPPENDAPSADVSRPGDFVVPTSANSPAAETSINAIDDTPQTKYLNFDKLNAGLTITPTAGPSLVVGLRLTSANDAPDRDPTRYILSGSNDGTQFTEISRGTIPNFTARFQAVSVAFNNTTVWKHYRLIFPTVRDAAAAVAVQIAEVELLGWVGGPPASFASAIRTTVETAMFNRNASACLRLPFNLDSAPATGELTLRLRYEDGYVAWLNGTEIARANAPSTLRNDSAAVTNRLRGAATLETSLNLSDRIGLLRPGRNVLAIQGLNWRADSRDFLLDARLELARTESSDAGYLSQPTPGAANPATLTGLIDEVGWSVEHGFFETPFELTLTCPTPGATIRYTTDGSEPTANSGTIAAAPIRIARSTVVRAAAFREGWKPSRSSTRTFLFLDDVVTQTTAAAVQSGWPATWSGTAADYGLDPRVVGPGGTDAFKGKYTRSLKADLQSLPTLSIVAPVADLFGPQGIYSNPESHGSQWERPISIELIRPDGQPGFQANAGVRIQGGAFRRFDLTRKKSFRVVFREKYGPTQLRYPLFGPDAADRFDNFVLRANSNDAWPWGGNRAVYIRDAFAMQTARELGIPASHSGFAHLYINGQYWGLYNPVERPDAAFAASYLGGAPEDWDSINQDSAPDGTYDAWNRMMSQLGGDLSKAANYQRLQGNNPDGTRNPAYENLVDVDNLIDYMILNFYVGNTDWPGRNWWAGRNRVGTEGFQFRPWDTETALDFNGIDTDVTGVNTAVATPYAALRANADFRLRFADHVYRHFFNGGPLYVNPANRAWNPARPENNRPAARFAALAAGVKSGIVGESARWGDQGNSQPFARDEHWQPEVDSILANYFPQRSSRVLDQFRRAGLYPKTDAPVMNQRGGSVPAGFQLSMSATAGTIFYTTNGSDPRAPVGTVIQYADPLTLNDLVTIRARVLNGTEWSALNEARFVVGTPVLRVSELHYHPADPNTQERAAGFSNADDFEFIELRNGGTTTIDLSGIRFIAGIGFEFPAANAPTLRPGGFLTLVRNQAAFEARYGANIAVTGQYSGKLDNSGERITVVDSAGTVLIDFTYGTTPPWPTAPDGHGPSLEIVDPAGNLNAPGNWRPSESPGGSPGKPNTAPPLEASLENLHAGFIRIRFQGRTGLGFSLLGTDALGESPWKSIRTGEARPDDSFVELVLDVGSKPTTRYFRISIP